MEVTLTENHDGEGVELLKAAWTVVSGFVSLLIQGCRKMEISARTIYWLGTPAGRPTFVMATTAFLTRVAEAVIPTEDMVLIRRAVTSEGLTTDQLIAQSEDNGRGVTDLARHIMGKPQFVTTRGKTYRLVSIHTSELAPGRRTLADIQSVAEIRRYGNPPVEVAGLLAQFTQDELGYRCFIVMHRPISIAQNKWGLLGLMQTKEEDECLEGWFVDPTMTFRGEVAFIFLAPEES